MACLGTAKDRDAIGLSITACTPAGFLELVEDLAHTRILDELAYPGCDRQVFDIAVKAYQLRNVREVVAKDNCDRHHAVKAIRQLGYTQVFQ
ncbi:hypothetical protein [Mycobacterium xenopi]|uniref:hypothetical protein n=1 Tax=Mycobacterium xenopi TaxID=1789 RepID=UPI000A15729F|nr:hypothetical protein [Mycobacterium xenopi]ORX19455.1 hypothetical protein AWC32_10805 [Mycobacterium xenopi]SPX94819.1 Uncharacterised protein [Mycobacterium xenopi]